MTIDDAGLFLITNHRKKPFEGKKKKKEKTNRVLSPRGRERARKGSVAAAAALIKHSTRSGPSLDPVAVIIGRSEAPVKVPRGSQARTKGNEGAPTPGL